ncbi:MAG: M28 family peptidase [Planctomycetaceae bacterium]
MLRSTFILLIAAAPVFAQSPDEPKFNAAEAAKRESALVSRTRQLTFEGRRAGEGYFDSTGSRIVFQSERQADNPFYQIYLMDLDTGDTDRVSPGTGKTTCAWIHPTANRVLFASTHGDAESVQKQKAELEFRASGKERRYSWDYDENYDIYDFDIAAKKYVNLTKVRGYDAEGSWSPDGKLIAFASNRNAYSKALSAEDKKKFEVDPAWAMDIFVMNADGSDVRQLTNVPGYDGGPFFSADGKKICWRRFSENGLTAEIMTMNIDGSDQKQLTKINAMSWAPYFHPTGEYLIFTTNRHGFGNFELYLVRADGAGEPVRVTYTDKFDGLPAFTPDGTKLSWTTQRSSSGNSQIFLAEWNHKAARQLLGLDGTAKPKKSMAALETRPEFAPADVVQHVEYLCKPELNGRMTGTEGAKMATDYVANYFDALGLKPAGDKNGWFQPFEFVAGAKLGEKNQLIANGKKLKVGEDWQPLSFSANGEVAEAGVVFGGYGLVAPKKGDLEEYDSFVHLDVKDKWVLVFRFLPEDVSDAMRQHLSKPDPIRFKSMLARDRGARGLIVVSGPTSQVRSQLVPLRHDGASGSSLPVISVTDAVAAAWLKNNGKDLTELQKKLDTGALAMGFEIKDLKISGAMDVQQVRSMGRNVVGRLQFGDKPSAQAVLIGAHVDHLGKGPAASSLAKGEERGGIHYGADDNASGVAAMLEVAEYFSDNRVKMAAKAKRDIIFAAWSGEELGLLGSKFYVENYEVPMTHGHGSHGHSAHGSHGSHGAASAHGASASAHGGAKADPHAAPKKSAHGSDPHSAATKVDPHAAAAAHSAGGAKKKAPPLTAMQMHGASKTPNIYPYIAACLNMDMVGRMEDKLVLQGIGSSEAWRGEIERRNAVVGLNLKLQEDCDLPTDASSFYKGGVPILAAFTGSHKDYHTPRDTPNKLNYEGAAQIAKFMALVARGLVLREEAIAYKVHETKATGDGTKASLRATLGTVPDYGDDVKGVLIGPPRKGFAAAKAGLKAGDVIVELAGKKVENIYDYTYAIEALKIGRETTIAVTRDGKRIEFKITPTSRN